MVCLLSLRRCSQIAVGSSPFRDKAFVPNKNSLTVSRRRLLLGYCCIVSYAFALYVLLTQVDKGITHTP